MVASVDWQTKQRWSAMLAPQEAAWIGRGNVAGREPEGSGDCDEIAGTLIIAPHVVFGEEEILLLSNQTEAFVIHDHDGQPARPKHQKKRKIVKGDSSGAGANCRWPRRSESFRKL